MRGKPKILLASNLLAGYSQTFKLLSHVLPPEGTLSWWNSHHFPPYSTIEW